MLLALIVRGRRKRPRDTYYISLKKAKEKSGKSSPPQLTDEEIKDMVENSGETPRKKSKDSMGEDYDPAMAGQGFGGGEDESPEADDDNEDYDPESVSFEKMDKAKKKRKRSRF